MLSLANLLLDSGLCTVSLETAKCAIQSLILFHDYARQSLSLPPVVDSARVSAGEHVHWTLYIINDTNVKIFLLSHGIFSVTDAGTYPAGETRSFQLPPG